MTTFLVTGATGFIGSAVVRALLADGQRVRALVRPGTPASQLDSAGVEVVRGDLLDAESLRAAVDGVDGVFHVAGAYQYWARDPSVLYRVNVDGTEALLEAARRAGVRRVVHTSTVATLKWPGRNRLADESSVASLDNLPGHYKRSKFLGESKALSFNNPGSFDVVVVNPTAPVGPGDSRPTPTGRIVLEFLRRRFPGYVDTALNICDVDDAAAGHVLAFDRGLAGERYILGSENLTIREIYRLLARVTGMRRTPVRVPYWLAMAAGWVSAGIEGRLLQREPYVPLEGLRVARHPMLADCTKAVRELGLPQRPAAEALERAAGWYVDNGYASPRKWLAPRGAGVSPQ